MTRQPFPSKATRKCPSSSIKSATSVHSLALLSPAVKQKSVLSLDHSNPALSTDLLHVVLTKHSQKILIDFFFNQKKF
jgi:hypothetical protein